MRGCNFHARGRRLQQAYNSPMMMCPTLGEVRRMEEDTGIAKPRTPRLSLNEESKADNDHGKIPALDQLDDALVDCELEDLRHNCLRVLRYLFYLALPLSVAACAFACVYGWIYVNTQFYTQDQWQYCIVYNSPKSTIIQDYAVSASSYGGQAFIFMGLGFKSSYLAMHDVDLIPYGLVVTCFTLLGQMVYRPVNPLIPVVTEMTPTLLSLTKYIHGGMYDGIPFVSGEPHTDCQPAVTFNRCFLAFQYLVLLCNVANLAVQVYAAIRTARLRESVRNELRLHRPACVIAGLSFASYVVAISAKENAAQNTLHIMQSFGVPYLFPFVRSSLDVIGLFQLLTVASVVYGTCKQEPEPFKWGAFTAYVHVLLSYPIMTSNFKSFSLYNFWETGNVMSPSQPSCTWFLQNDKAHAGGSNRAFLFEWAAVHAPSSEEAICLDARVSLYAQFMQFALMHLAVVACLCVVLANWRLERPSFQLFGGDSRASLLASPLLPSSECGDVEGDIDLEAGSTSSSFYRQQAAGQQQPGNGVQRRSRASSGGRTRTPSSVNDHLLGPVLD